MTDDGAQVSGENDLQVLLRNMQPVLDAPEYVFCTFGTLSLQEAELLAPVAACLEEEGWTLVVPRALADARGLTHGGVFRKISLHVHSSLEAVGLTAAFATALARQGISANVVAGYFHDHIFVPSDQAELALSALEALAGQQGSR